MAQLGVSLLLGCLRAYPFQNLTLPAQLFRVGLWEHAALSRRAILRLGCVFVEESFGFRRLE